MTVGMAESPRAFKDFEADNFHFGVYVGSFRLTVPLITMPITERTRPNCILYRYNARKEFAKNVTYCLMCHARLFFGKIFPHTLELPTHLCQWAK